MSETPETSEIAGLAIPDYPAAYAGVRTRVTDLIRTATPAQLQATAPATPDWRVRDVLAHLVGVPADVLAGRLDGVASDAWTEAQVARHRDSAIDDVLAEWAETAPQVEPLIPSFGVVAGQAVADAVTHEHDIRDALDQPGARDSDAVFVGSAWMAQWIGTTYAERGDGPLRIETDLWQHTYGDGAAATTLEVSAFELLRAATGRRSADQIRGWTWHGPALVDAVVMRIFVPRPADFTG